jgi:hypothetical protein
MSPSSVSFVVSREILRELWWRRYLTSACCFHEKASLSIGRRGGPAVLTDLLPSALEVHAEVHRCGAAICRAISKIGSSNRSPRTGRLSSWRGRGDASFLPLGRLPQWLIHAIGDPEVVE